jgi:hypothetical protein
MLKIFLLPLFSLSLHASADEITGKQNWFDQGLRAYQSKNWDQARDNFEKALQFQPAEAAIMYNLGLAYFQLNKKGYAVGYWRRALAFAPLLSGPEESLEKIQDKFHFSRLEKSPWAVSAHDFLTRVDWNIGLAALAITLGFTGWLWMGFWQRRKVALLSESDETPSPSYSLLFLTVLFVITAVGVSGKWLDEQKIRGTVVNASAELKSAPTDDGVTLSSLPEASEVQILSSHNDWLQINTGEGSGGWVKKSDVLAASKEL